MDFLSYDFLFFFLLLFIIYWRLDRKKQNLLLLLGSYFFYACWDWRFLFLMLFVTGIGYICAIGIYRAEQKHKNSILWSSIAIHAVVLFFFKYYNFFIDNFNRLISDIMRVGDISSFWLDIILPLGISYYIFKSLSYNIDIYRKVIKQPATSFLDYALYISFFPQILSGPIERAANFLPQVAAPREFNVKFFSESCYLFFWGLFKKVFVADGLAQIVNNIFKEQGVVSGFDVLIGAYAGTFRLYADFSGYTDMAIGIAGCLGFRTMLNFNLPFFAKNPFDIWRRWHISLSSWCRDYIFYYLNRARLRLGLIGIGGTSLAIIITMITMGVWHEASWAFLIWGLYHGILLTVANALGKLSGNFLPDRLKKKNKWLGALGMFITFHSFVFGELLYMSTSTYKSVGQAVNVIRNLFFNFTLTSGSATFLVIFIFHTWILIVIEFFQFIKNDHFVVLKWNFWIKTVFYVLLIWLIVLYWGFSGPGAFIYGEF
ncbi:MBOAT family O-acyltransferase [Candidatus Omnitrophota bacterium]